MPIRYILFIIMLSISTLAHADAAQPYNQVDLQSEAGVEVVNDLMTVQLNIEVQDDSPAAVSKRINSTMNEALRTSSYYPTVKASNGWQTTHPVYGRDNRMVGWRGAAQLKLESKDFKSAGELISKLQSGQLHMAGIAFSISPEARQKVENELITEALASFRKRADTVRMALGGTGITIVRINIGNNSMPHPIPMMAAGKGMVSSFAESTPVYAGGDTRMTVVVSGTVEVTTGKSNAGGGAK